MEDLLSRFNQGEDIADVQVVILVKGDQVFVVNRHHHEPRDGRKVVLYLAGEFGQHHCQDKSEAEQEEAV